MGLTERPPSKPHLLSNPTKSGSSVDMPSKTSKSKTAMIRAEDTPQPDNIPATGDAGVTKKRGRGHPVSGKRPPVADGEQKRKKKRPEPKTNYARPLHKVLKQVH